MRVADQEAAEVQEYQVGPAGAQGWEGQGAVSVRAGTCTRKEGGEAGRE